MQNYKFDHYRLPSKNLLTVATLLDYEQMTYRVGYTVCYTKKDPYVRVVGNRLAVKRLEENEIKIILDDWLTEDQLKHHYLAHLAIQAILADMVRTQYVNETTGKRVEFAISTVREVRQLLESLGEKVIQREIENGVEDLDDHDDVEQVHEVGVGISKVCPDDVIVYDYCGRYVPIFKNEIRRSALQLLRLAAHFDHSFEIVDPFNLPKN